MKKRKYNKSGKYSKVSQGNVQSNSKPIEGQSSVIVPIDVLTAEYKGDTDIIWDGKLIAKAPDKKFTFEDLPLSIRTGVLKTIETRKLRGLFDDSKERKQRALEYWRRK
jgi:hypothetical protein